MSDFMAQTCIASASLLKPHPESAFNKQTRQTRNNHRHTVPMLLQKIRMTGLKCIENQGTYAGSILMHWTHLCRKCAENRRI